MARGIFKVRFLRLLFAGLVAALAFSMALPAEARMCRFFGTSPFCEGSCPRGWERTGRTSACFTGRKVECCERMGSTTSDGPGSPYTDGRPNKTTSPKPNKPPPLPSRNRAICDGNCPYPAGSAKQEACIQKCLSVIGRR